MTALDDALEALRVDGVVQHRVTLAGDWAFEVRPDPGYATFYAMNSGFAWIVTPEDPPQRLRPGSTALVRAGMTHVVARKRDLSPIDARSFFSKCAFTEPLHLRSGRGGARSDFITGFYYFEQHERDPLLASLPPLLLVGSSPQGRERPDGWIETLSELNQELRERAPGYLTVANHLTEILLIRLIRAWLLTPAAAGAVGFLGGVVDPCIALALNALKSDLGRSWTVARLAKCAGLSRTAFATRFSSRMGEGPASYARRVRLQKACELLERTQMGTAHVGAHVGYHSEAAFIRVFAREVGMTPAQWRRRHAT
jgi:AraC-like DNA-binding protein